MSKSSQTKSGKSLVGIYHFSVAGFLTALILLLVASPFLQHIAYGDFAESALLTLVLISAVLAVGRRHKTLLLSIGLVAPTILGRWFYQFWPDHMLPDVYLISSLAFVLFIISQLLRFIFQAPQVNSEILCAGISTYLMLGLLWANAYSLIAYRMPGAFLFTQGLNSNHTMKGFTSLYFSYLTLSTVGYGDIIPASDITRMLSAAEAITGILFVAVLISRLVSMHSSQSLLQAAKSSKDKN